jgi:hypothetical protein
MAKIRIPQDNLLTSEEFKQWLEQSSNDVSPLEEILLLMREMITFEKQYNMQTEEFYTRFIRGEMGDAMDFIEWTGVYELYLDAKAKIESQLSATKRQANTEK